MKPCVFCTIIRGEAAAHVVYDDAACLGFLDTRPLFHGHVLLVPRAHVETLVELPSSSVEPLFSAAQALARAVRDAMGADGTFVAMNNGVSQSVPHLHVHVVPRKHKDGLRGFFWPRSKYDGEDEMRAVARKISGALSA